MVSRRQLGVAGIAAVASPFVMTGSAAAQTRAQAQMPTALDLINMTPAVSIFAEVIKKHGLEESFNTGEHGYFIPTDEFVEQLPGSTVDRLRADRDAARATILNHVTNYTNQITTWGTASTDRLVVVRTLADRRLTLTIENGRAPTIGGRIIIMANVRARNGLVHGIAGVLVV